MFMGALVFSAVVFSFNMGGVGGLRFVLVS
jgi:hypothetical protein